MGESNRSAVNTSRRSLLKRVGVAAGSLATLGGVRTIAASGPDSWDRAVAPQSFEPDVGDRSAVRDARIRIHEHGGVSKTLRVDENAGTGDEPGNRRSGGPPDRSPRNGDLREGAPAPADTPNGWGDEEPTLTSYSLNLRPGSGGVSARSAVSGEIGPGDLTADLASSETQLGAVAPGGLPEAPDLSHYDAVYYGQTSSQECGTLARTKVQRHGSWYDDERSAVDGDACEGAAWDETFRLFCPIQKRYVGHCDVPSAFDTTWNVEFRGSDGRRAGTVFSCSNFPAVSGTVVTVHTVDASGADVTYRASHGIVPGPNWADLEFDMNGITNVATDVATLATALGTVVAPFTWAVTLWLLDDEANVVR